MEKGQFTVYATFQAKSEKYEELKKVNQQSFDLTKEAPGLQQAFFLEPPTPDKPFVFIALWRSKEDFGNFMKAPKTQEFHNRASIKKLLETSMEKATAEFYTIMDTWQTSAN